ncbi:hypothetical protein HUJ04_004416 [Dendroctonus ponderosae]|uniref:Uncharacterized protein n=3 Tax=Dendroctonus ponderosae TaxID=77166 RepID=A0AAR5PAF5_DENPD|nr:hypothetical protein HUJ04_004416 [Dendroctonus ponderosae]
MRCLFLVAIILVAVRAQILSQSEKEKMRAIHEGCMKETGADQALIHKAVKGEYVDDPKLKNQIFCVTQKIGFTDESGEIMKDLTVKKLTEKFKNEKVINAAVEKCVDKKATPSDTAFEFVKCLHSYAPEGLDIMTLMA